ncbi:hypothetical protein EB118_03520 [bacterium]|nr:hypothetical protein [bacterium]NDC94049.1 hypothetical protein [bacterium]NDD82735.1 hypothetical protein [bacterium]NDG29155.1 hypothetical protein [bacterium]
MEKLYSPTTKKALFQKEVVQLVRNWTEQLDQVPDKRQLLCVHGPVGCGKSATLKLMLKQMHVHNFEADNVRNTSDVMFPGYNQATIGSNKPNVVLIENIEPAEKNIVTCIEHIWANSCVPIVVTFNNQKLLELFTTPFSGRVTEIRFSKPSLLELNKLVKTVVKDLTGSFDFSTETIVYKSDFDLRQLYFMFDQLRVYTIVHKGEAFDVAEFLQSIDTKEKELDMPSRIDIALNTEMAFDFTNVFLVCSSEPHSISNAIYANYLNSGASLDTLADIANDLSYGAVINGHMFDNQWWYLYDLYTLTTCVAPSYKLKSHCTTHVKRGQYATFKDVSMNYNTSYNDIRKMYSENYSKLTRKSNDTFMYADNLLRDPITCSQIAHILSTCIKSVSEYFDLQKRGKNMSRKEKIEIAEKLLENEHTHPAHSRFQILVDIVYKLVLFEVDISTILQKRNELDITVIDMRVLKRFVNIFLLNTINFKNHIETALQYCIIKRILNSTKLQPRAEPLEIDLDQIWET